jgi:hypothetical protein
MAYAPVSSFANYFHDSNGRPLVQGTVEFYESGTTTPATVYSDSDGTPAGTSVTLDARGEPEIFKRIFLDTAVNYKAVVKDRFGATVYTIDPLGILGAGAVTDAHVATGSKLKNRIDDVASISDYLPFGELAAIRNGTSTFDCTTAFESAIADCALSTKPRLLLGQGKFIIDSLTLDSLRGFEIIGERGADPVNSKTKIYWKGGSLAAALLFIRSSHYLTFRNITFFTNGNVGKASMIEFQCNGQSTAAPRSKFASTKVTFDYCGFLVKSGDECSTATINQKSTVQVHYKDCVIHGTRAVKLGADTDADPNTAEATVPDGRAVSTTFERCIIRGDIVRERVLGAYYLGNFYNANSDGSGVMAGHTVSGLEEVRDERWIGNICDDVDVTNTGKTWVRGGNHAAAGGITAHANQVNGVSIGFTATKGVVVVKGNRFIARSLPGATNWYGVVLNDGITRADVNDNNWTGLLALNTSSVVAYAVRDLRTSFENEKQLLARQLAADVGIAATATWQTIFSRSVDLAGGPARVAYSLSVSAATDATFTARVTVNGTAIDGSYVRYTTGTAATKLFTLTLPPVLTVLTPTIVGSPATVAVQIQQSTGTLATVKGGGIQNSACLVEMA